GLFRYGNVHDRWRPQRPHLGPRDGGVPLRVQRPHARVLARTGANVTLGPERPPHPRQLRCARRRAPGYDSATKLRYCDSVPIVNISEPRSKGLSARATLIVPSASRSAITFRPENAPMPLSARVLPRSEEHTSELQSRENLVCR